MYDIFYHICLCEAGFVVWLLIAFNQIYSFDVPYILCTCVLGIHESEISYVCVYVDRHNKVNSWFLQFCEHT
jgi:hypothetical protein